MSNDLVGRLRDGPCVDSLDTYEMLQQAADLIEELEKQIAAGNKQIKELENELENMEYEMCELENNP